jgi:vancomycin resistance protein YoaR
VTNPPSPGDDSPPPVAPTSSLMSPAPGVAGTAGRSLAIVGLVSALLAASYIVALLVVGDHIPRGTSVVGVNIGGLTPAAAVERLQTDLADKSAVVEVSLDGDAHTVSAVRSGLAFDAPATVAKVEERSFRPWTLAGQLRAHEVAPVVTVKDRRLTRTVSSLARRVDDAVREGAVHYDGLEIVAVEPRAGLALDRAAAFDAMVAGYLGTEAPIELPIGPVQPKVTSDQVNEVAEGMAVDAIDGDITLEVAGQSFVLTPVEIARVLSYRPVDGELRPTVDIEMLHQQMGDAFDSVGTPALDASFDVSSGKPVVVPSQRGEGVSDKQLTNGVVQAIAAPDRFAEITLAPIPADLTTGEAKDLGIKKVVSRFTQEFPYAAYRVTNIGLASDKINGTVLEPGEVFSLNEIVGERTPENGFVKGYVIVGNRLVEDYGGAVSTMTTAMWHTAFFAGMTRVEQRAHGYWISRYLPGLEATVSWGNLDLKFANDTPYGVLITSTVTDSSVTVTMWSTKYWTINAEFGARTNPRPAGTVYDGAKGCVAQYGVDGFDITVTRVWSRNGEVKQREPLDTSYISAPTVICKPKPKPKPDPKPTKNATGKPKPSQSPSPKPSGSGGDGG